MNTWLAQLPIGYSVALFMVSAAVIGFFGIRMTYIARDLAVATGLGEALMGAVFIGATTSLSGITASATAAWQGQASLAVSNSLGGIAAQTLFLVLGDAVYRKANLEYAAASVENMMMSAQLMVLLCILAIAFTIPGAALFHVHPASLILILTYLFTLKLLVDTHEMPMWLPRRTKGTVTEDMPNGKARQRKDLGPLLAQFSVCALAVGVAGYLIAGAGMNIVEQTGFSAGIVGGIFIAIATSLPELVVAITAIRMGSLTLAVGDIVGGNAFDTLFVAVADVMYREGSIYEAIVTTEKVWLGSAMLMNAILLMGLMYRERKGIGNIGMESAMIMLVYICTVTYLGAS